MKKKLFVSSPILLFLLLLAMQGFDLAVANPFSFYTPIEPVSGTIPPSIAVASPTNNSANPSVVFVSLHVDKPELSGCSTSITGVYYTLDNGQRTKLYTNYVNGEGNGGVPALDKTFELTSLPSGNHNLTIEAWGVVLKNIVQPPKGFQDTGVFYIGSNSTINFTVDDQLPTPQSPTTAPISPTPSPTFTPSPTVVYPPPTSTPKQNAVYATSIPSPNPTPLLPTPTSTPNEAQPASDVSSNYWQYQAFFYIIVAAATALSLLTIVYRSRRKSKTANKKT